MNMSKTIKDKDSLEEAHNWNQITQFWQELTMNTELSSQVIGVTRSTAAYFLESYAKNSLQDSHSNECSKIQPSKEVSVISYKKKVIVKVDSFTKGIREHVKLAPKLTETLKGKLSLGARILQLGGVEKVFKKLFSVRNGEKLVKASQCYLSTTTGPIAGLLFISTDRLAFCSERSIKIVSPNGKLLRTYYKVSIPLRKIMRANTSQNVKKPSQKYIEVVTVDKFDFWFMGFLNHQKSFRCLQEVMVSLAQ